MPANVNQVAWFQAPAAPSGMASGFPGPSTAISEGYHGPPVRVPALSFPSAPCPAPGLLQLCPNEAMEARNRTQKTISEGITIQNHGRNGPRPSPGKRKAEDRASVSHFSSPWPASRSYGFLVIGGLFISPVFCLPHLRLLHPVDFLLDQTEIVRQFLESARD